MTFGWDESEVVVGNLNGYDNRRSGMWKSRERAKLAVCVWELSIHKMEFTQRECME